MKRVICLTVLCYGLLLVLVILLFRLKKPCPSYGLSDKKSLSTLLIYLGKIMINRLTPSDPYMSRTAPLTSKRYILYIYSTNIGTEYFKHALYSPFFSLQNAVCFITLTCLIPVLFTFYIQNVLKLKKIIPAPKG